MHSCNGRGCRTTLVKDAGFDAVECTFLETVRFFFLSYAEPETQAWEHGFTRSQMYFGRELGCAVAYDALQIVHAMRISRKNGFRFSNPRCRCCVERLTDHERLLMNVVCTMRQGNKAAANANAMMLCEGNATQNLLDLTEQFATSLAPLNRMHAR